MAAAVCPSTSTASRLPCLMRLPLPLPYPHHNARPRPTTPLPPTHTHTCCKNECDSGSCAAMSTDSSRLTPVTSLPLYWPHA